MKLKQPQPRLEQPPRSYDVAVAPITEKAKRYDYRADTTEQDLQGAIASLEELRGRNWWGYVELAADIATLFPEKKDELGLDDEAWAGIFRELEQERASDLGSFLRMANAIALVAPEKKEMLGISDDTITQAKQEMSMYENMASPNWWDYFRIILLIVKLRPEVKDELAISQQAWDGIFSKMQNYQQMSPSLFLSMAANICLVYPEKKHELEVNDETWDKLFAMQATEESRQGFQRNWGDIYQNKKNLAILAADEAKITDQGIQIINYQPLTGGPPLPQRNTA